MTLMICFFNEEALYHFLQTHFSRKLRDYDLYIARAYLPVSQEFVDRMTQNMASDLRLSVLIESRYNGYDVDIRQDRMLGMVYLSQLTIEKPENVTNQSELIQVVERVGYW